MKTIKFTAKIIVNESPEFIFDYTQDYSKRLIWDTFLKKADLMGSAIKADKGVKAFCVAYNGLGMETEYVTFRRPKVTAIRMTKGPYMFNSFLGSWTFNYLENNQSEVVFLYLVGLRFPFNLLGYFIRRNLQNNVKQRLINLKTCIEKKSRVLAINNNG